jgi:membrane protease YdiL (CAAX protease family)
LTVPPAAPRRRPVLRAVIAVIGFYLLGGLVVALLLLPFAGELLSGVSPSEMAETPTPAFALAQGLTSLLAFGAATWLVGWVALRLGAGELRWRSRLGWVRGFGAGLVFGILPAAIVMTLGLFTAGAGWVRDGGSLGGWTAQVGKTILLLAPAALSEELMFRGLPMVIVAGVFGRGRTILLLSILFAMAHVTNPGVTISGLGNIALAGILLSLAFYSPGGMWTAFGAHLGWNSTLAALGAPVSGLPFDIPFIDYTMGSPTWLTGGRFGPEGGLLGTLVLAGAVVLAAIWVRKEPT